MEVVGYCVNKKRLFIVGIIFFLVMCISGIYALKDEMSDIENGLSTSSVDIEIKEYNQNNELFDEDGKHVSPGDEIVLIPRVNNLGIECYIRAKFTYTIDDDSFSVVDYVTGNYSSWTKKGEYYYYDSIFEKNASVDLFNKVSIPNLSSEYNGKKVVIHIVVDAIQARNFDGNWDNVEIKESIDRTYDIDYDGESSVIYEDDTKNHIVLDDGFFDNLGNILPGDRMNENVKILNSSKNKNKYYLAIDYDELSQDEIALLRKIKLIIRNSSDEVLVDSNLADKSKHNLGIFNENEGDSYEIELSFPSDADNDYSRLFTKILWKFSYDTVEQHDEDSDDETDGNSDKDNIPVPDNSSNPATGDFKFDWSITVFLLSTLGLIITLIYGKINNKKYKEKRI